MCCVQWAGQNEVGPVTGKALVTAYLKLVHQNEDIDLVIESRHASHGVEELLRG